MNGFSNPGQLLRKTLERIGPGPGANTLLVFNGLSWPRSGPVHVERMPAELRDGPLSLVDLGTGSPVPYEDVPGTHRQVVFFANGVPAAGDRLHAIAQGHTAPARRE